MGKQTYFRSPQFAKPQILVLILQSQIGKFYRCASPQITNAQIFMTNLASRESANFFKILPTTVCHKTVLKVVFYVLSVRAFYALFLRKKVVFAEAQKRLGPRNANSQ